MKAIPKYYEVALGEIGVREVPGAGSNPRIDAYLQTCGMSDDATPWCAGFVGWSLDNGGNKGTGAANARSYERWGVSAFAAHEAIHPANMQIGDVVVLRRGTKEWQGHVGFFAGAGRDGYIKLLGGNQGNAVSIAEFPVSDIRAVRRPKTASNSKSIASGVGAAATGVAAETVSWINKTTVVVEQVTDTLNKTSAIKDAAEKAVGGVVERAGPAQDVAVQVVATPNMLSMLSLGLTVVSLLFVAFMIYDRFIKIKDEGR